MKLTEENFEKPGEIGEDIEMSTTSFECTENLDLTKHSLRSWKRIIWGDMVLNSNQSPSLKVLSSKRHVENHDPNHSAELHPHQKKNFDYKVEEECNLAELVDLLNLDKICLLEVAWILEDINWIRDSFDFIFNFSFTM